MAKSISAGHATSCRLPVGEEFGATEVRGGVLVAGQIGARVVFSEHLLPWLWAQHAVIRQSQRAQNPHHSSSVLRSFPEQR